jgi:hypothetical protein
MTIIEMPDQQAAALKAKAAAQGLTLEAWLKKLADEDAPAASVSPKQAAVNIREIRERTRPDPEGWTIRDYIDHGRR